MPKNKNKKRFSSQQHQINKITFLGTGSMAPLPLKRNVSSMALSSTSGNLYMIDCGEGTQHQLKLSNLRTSKLHSIFLTHLHGDHCYGIPGLLHSIRATDRTQDLYIYGPVGTKEMIETTLFSSGGWKAPFKLTIYELSVHNTIYKCDGLKKKQNSNNNKINSVTFDEITNPQNKTSRYKPKDIIYLGEIEKGIDCYACPITHRVETFGYCFLEKDKPGKLDAQKAMKLGAKGKDLGTLKQGKDVKINGNVIKSSDVVGKSVKGRKIGIMQDCSYIDSSYGIMKDCDVMIHEATYDEEHYQNAIKFGHSTAKMAVTNALKANAKLIILTHFSGRFTDTHQTLTEENLKNNNNNSNNSNNNKNNNNKNNNNKNNNNKNNNNSKNNDRGSDKMSVDNNSDIVMNDKTIVENETKEDNNDNDDDDDDDDDMGLIDKLQKEGDEVLLKYSTNDDKNNNFNFDNRLWELKNRVRCACDFMIFDYNTNVKTFIMNQKLSLKEKNFQHFIEPSNHLNRQKKLEKQYLDMMNTNNNNNNKHVQSKLLHCTV